MPLTESEKSFLGQINSSLKPQQLPQDDGNEAVGTTMVSGEHATLDRDKAEPLASSRDGQTPHPYTGEGDDGYGNYYFKE